jgi:uncharacterized protein
MKGMTAAGLLLLFSLPVFADQASSAIYEEVETQSADIWSEGSRMSATVFFPSSANDGDKLPAIVMAHGWGGTAASLSRDAYAFAQGGYFVLTFDYRGWGDSDGRVIVLERDVGAELNGALPEGTFMARVQELRGIVDPVDMLADWQNAIHWLHGEPRVDASRIGLWGTSLSGGFVVELAMRDPRVRAVHSQVGFMTGRDFGITDAARNEAARRARGEIGYPAANARVIGNLRGAPIMSRFADYSPADHINQAGDTPLQFVLADQEELFPNSEHGILAHERYEGPKRLVIIPEIRHYGIYNEAWQASNDLALEWFNQHLR